MSKYLYQIYSQDKWHIAYKQIDKNTAVAGALTKEEYEEFCASRGTSGHFYRGGYGREVQPQVHINKGAFEHAISEIGKTIPEKGKSVKVNDSELIAAINKHYSRWGSPSKTYVIKGKTNPRMYRISDEVAAAEKRRLAPILKEKEVKQVHVSALLSVAQRYFDNKCPVFDIKTKSQHSSNYKNRIEAMGYLSKMFSFDQMLDIAAGKGVYGDKTTKNSYFIDRCSETILAELRILWNNDAARLKLINAIPAKKK